MSVETMDRVLLKTVSHTAKGAAAILHSEPLTNAIKEIEASAMQSPWSDVKTNLGEVLNLFIDIQDFIDNYIEDNHLYESIDLSAYTIYVLDEVGIYPSVFSNMLNSTTMAGIKYFDSIHDLETTLKQDDASKSILISTCIMPDLLGLDAANQIRTGNSPIPNDIPIILILDQRENSILNHAINLDVQGIMFPEITRKSIYKHVLRAVDWICAGKSWLKPPSSYSPISVQEISNAWFENNAKQMSQDNETKPANSSSNSSIPCQDIKNISCYSELNQDVMDERGEVLIKKPSIITIQNVYLLRDIFRNEIVQ